MNTKRRSLRLPGYDYSQAGAYCVTVCGHERALLFGDVLNKQMVLNDSGRMVAECWNDIPIQFSHVELDEFVVMPNHIHGIVLIRGRGRGVLQYAPTGPRSLSQTIGAILRGFKSVATSRVNESGNTPGAKLWQRDYYEHIIRNDEELNRVRESINDNPAEGEFDRENPTGLPTPSQERRRRQDLF